VLAKLTDALIHDVRDELAATLRDVVSRAVSQELARQRSR
jgi:aspartate oxidase